MEIPDVKGTTKPKYSFGNLSMLDHLEPDEIEKITVKPSTELIPDEYEHEDNSKGLVLIFYSKTDQENMVMLRHALSHQGYHVPDANIYDASTKEFVMESLKAVAFKDHQDKTCFILVFMGESDGRDDRFLPDEESDKQNCIPVRDVWSLFTSDNCPSLKYKPKVFIFQACKKIAMVQYKIMHDNGNEKPPPGAYDIPAEADMLLIYNKIEVPWARKHFITQLSNNLYYDGHKNDIIELVTHTDYQNEMRPLIMSTLTRKFYVRSSNQRGHHYDLYKNHDTVVEQLKDVKEKITKLEEQETESDLAIS